VSSVTQQEVNDAISTLNRNIVFKEQIVSMLISMLCEPEPLISRGALELRKQVLQNEISELVTKRAIAEQFLIEEEPAMVVPTYARRPRSFQN
jgi:hypothetical protein